MYFILCTSLRGSLTLSHALILGGQYLKRHGVSGGMIQPLRLDSILHPGSTAQPRLLIWQILHVLSIAISSHSNHI